MIQEIEGYLMVEAAREEGRVAAERFVGRLPWLTESQADEVRRAYADEYVALRRDGWGWCAERARSLRGEYEGRYLGLRRRLCGVVCAGVAVLGVGVALIMAL
ncbi:hypothetical protein ACIREE_30865 [Streptomyces sp. NPDC102467]|uniref:hypothetical protein n=1 Tax=Streptomyces sp. NPDC102467 TaxID=3366179 RepID=UPI003826FE96